MNLKNIASLLCFAIYIKLFMPKSSLEFTSAFKFFSTKLEKT